MPRLHYTAFSGFTACLKCYPNWANQSCIDISPKSLGGPFSGSGERKRISWPPHRGQGTTPMPLQLLHLAVPCLYGWPALPGCRDEWVGQAQNASGVLVSRHVAHDGSSKGSCLATEFVQMSKERMSCTGVLSQAFQQSCA